MPPVRRKGRFKLKKPPDKRRSPSPQLFEYPPSSPSDNSPSLLSPVLPRTRDECLDFQLIDLSLASQSLCQLPLLRDLSTHSPDFTVQADLVDDDFFFESPVFPAAQLTDDLIDLSQDDFASQFVDDLVDLSDTDTEVKSLCLDRSVICTRSKTAAERAADCVAVSCRSSVFVDSVSVDNVAVSGGGQQMELDSCTEASGRAIPRENATDGRRSLQSAKAAATTVSGRSRSQRESVLGLDASGRAFPGRTLTDGRHSLPPTKAVTAFDNVNIRPVSADGQFSTTLHDPGQFRKSSKSRTPVSVEGSTGARLHDPGTSNCVFRLEPL